VNILAGAVFKISFKSKLFLAGPDVSLSYHFYTQWLSQCGKLINSVLAMEREERVEGGEKLNGSEIKGRGKKVPQVG